MELFKRFNASTRKGHPPTSHEAEERVQEHVSRHAKQVLIFLKCKGPHTADRLDFMGRKILGIGWKGRAHRRMLDLETAGFVSREQKKGDRELTCTITDKGIEYLEGLKNENTYVR